VKPGLTYFLRGLRGSVSLRRELLPHRSYSTGPCSNKKAVLPNGFFVPNLCKGRDNSRRLLSYNYLLPYLARVIRS
jgi:hypothetical protein